MAALEALLSHPVVAQVQGDVVAGGAGADDDHAAGGADEFRRGQRRLARMLEDDAWACLLAERVPDGLAEGAGALGPVAIGLGVLGVGHGSPVVELRAIDDAGGAVLHAELTLGLVGDDGDRASALGPRDLERHAPEPSRRAPDEHHIAALYRVRRPAHQHPVRSRRAEKKAAGGLPGQALRLGDALVRLGPRELAVAAVVGLVAPDARALG